MSLFSSLGNYLFGVPQPSSAPYTQQAQQAQQMARQYAGREQSDYNNEAGLADNLWKTVNGTAPSVADTQLQQSFGQNLRSGLAMGSGASGSNAVLARYLASQATGDQGAQLAQAAAIQRAKETADAQARLGQVYGNMDASSAGLYGTNLSSGLGYSNLANNVDQANAQRDQQSEAAGLQFLSGVGSMYFGRPPTGGGSAPYAGNITNGSEATAAMGW
jgi:hypothetical protein